MAGKGGAKQKPDARQWSECGNYWFDAAAADAAVAFFPAYLRLTAGEWAGRPFVLEGWQEHDIIRPLFGWKRKDGTRRYRRCYVWIPRKNGKTELAAGVALLALIADGEMGGQVFSIAADEKQAKLVFDKATAMVGWSPELSKHLTCFKTSIWCADLASAFKPLSGNARGKHGLNMSALVGDEIHEWRDSDLYTFVHQSSAARRQPIEFLISTAGTREGYGWEAWDYCLKLLGGEVDDPETLVIVYAADPEADWTTPETWAKANPNIGVSVKLDYLERECREAQESPRKENDFKRYHLNIWTEQAVRWLPIDVWDECGLADPSAPAAPLPELAAGVTRKPVNDRWKGFDEALFGRRCFGGLDLSSTTDLTAWVMMFPPEEADGRWQMIVRPFLPEARLADRVRRDRAPYDQWLSQGALITTPGNVVDYEWVKDQVYRDAQRYRIEAVGIDRFLAPQIAIQIQNEGLNAQFFGQGFLSLSAPSKELERLVLDRKLDHGGHPAARWCAGNVAIATDPAGNIKPAKDKSTERIDIIAAAVNALGMALGEMVDGPSVYETRGIRVF